MRFSSPVEDKLISLLTLGMLGDKEERLLSKNIH
jgi:hypothetical protein